LKFQPGKDERFEMKDEYGMNMSGMDSMKMESMSMGDNKMDHSKMDHSMMSHNEKDSGVKNDSVSKTMMHHSSMPGMDMASNTMDDQDDTMQGMNMDMFSEYNYDYLKSPEKTTYDSSVPVNEILLNLTGNMQRYIWSLNGVPLSEADKIKIKSDQVTRITLNNLTMMHHPMHLHGHFFRVINKNGDYSPLKHTVNVPPMESVTIEFYGNEYGDWFFHCHILYHMMGGMARIYSYDTPRDPRLANSPVKKLINESDKFYTWGIVDAASHMTALNVVSSNIRNQFNLSAEYGWNQNLEGEFTYERYLHDYLRVFGGVNVENKIDESADEITTTAIAGVRYFTPYMFNLDVRLDSKLRPQISLSRAIAIFPRTILFGSYEYQADFGWVDDFPNGDNFNKEVTWSTGLEYILSKNFSVMASYDNRFGAGGGLSARF
ncbi:MAG: multicopper oxidase domain-containing protein, partial [Leeuwenhoekiella sp.]